MKEHIHTIPVVEALRAPGACAFCAMTRTLEEEAIRFIMGPAYMEADVRAKTDKSGFCRRHMDAMHKEQNRLGLALMLHTHLQELSRNIKSLADYAAKPTLFGAGSDAYVEKMAGHLAATCDDCYVCQSVGGTFASYVDTFFSLWADDGLESDLILMQKSFCLKHFTVLLQYAAKLGAKRRKKFANEIMPIWHKSMERLEADLERFIKKFDCNYKEEPWENAKDALPRALALLGGRGAAGG